MFRSKTVFVIGAGASCEAGFPDGSDLKKKISDLLNIEFEYNNQRSGDIRIVESLRRFVQSEDGQRGDINPFLTKCHQIRARLPMALSIDNYIDAHDDDPAIELCGKLGIAKGILNSESTSKFRSKERHRDYFDMNGVLGTWYSKLFSLLHENINKSSVDMIFDNVVFITFNYDRSLERFLVQAIEEYYELSRYRSEEIVSSLKIFHPYGKVGDLPWQTKERGIGYGDCNGADLLALTKQIKTFTERSSDEQIVSSMRNHIEEAENLVFLGFRFHTQNLELIAPARPSNAKKAFSTALGLSYQEQMFIADELYRTLGLKMNVKGGSIPFEIMDQKCADFFNTHWSSLKS